MWTDMSEIVRPTRDGIHGREYISTAVDVGRKLSYLALQGNELLCDLPPVTSLPMPLLIDLIPDSYGLPQLDNLLLETAVRTNLIAILDAEKFSLSGKDAERILPHLALYLSTDAPLPSVEIFKRMRMVEIQDSQNTESRIGTLKKINPEIIISVRVNLDSKGIPRAIALGDADVEVIHIVADTNGNEIGAPKPLFVKDMIREIHKALVEKGRRDDVTLIAGGGIALAEHMAKGFSAGRIWFPSNFRCWWRWNATSAPPAVRTIPVR